MHDTFFVSSCDDDFTMITRRDEMAEVNGRIVSVVEEEQPIFFQMSKPPSRVGRCRRGNSGLFSYVFQCGINLLRGAGINTINPRESAMC
jgi:hypothetical protein